MNDFIKQANRAVELAQRSLSDLLALTFTGDEDKDNNILDEIMEFVYDDANSMADKISIVKKMAAYFGDDPALVDEAYVNDLLSDDDAEYEDEDYEEASAHRLKSRVLVDKIRTRVAKISKSKKKSKETATDTTKWFGTKPSIKIESDKLNKIIRKNSSLVEKAQASFLKENKQIGKAVIKAIEKASGTKASITGVVNQGSSMTIKFGLDKFVDIANVSDSRIKLTKMGYEYTLNIS